MLIITDVSGKIPDADHSLVLYAKDSYKDDVAVLDIREASVQVDDAVMVFLISEQAWKGRVDREGVVRLLHRLEQCGINMMAVGSAHEVLADIYGGVVLPCKGIQGTMNVTLLKSSDDQTGDFWFDNDFAVISAPLGWSKASVNRLGFARLGTTMMSRTITTPEGGKASFISVQFYPERSGEFGREVLEQFCTASGASKKPLVRDSRNHKRTRHVSSSTSVYDPPLKLERSNADWRERYYSKGEHHWGSSVTGTGRALMAASASSFSTSASSTPRLSASSTSSSRRNPKDALPSLPVYTSSSPNLGDGGFFLDEDFGPSDEGEVWYTPKTSRELIEADLHLRSLFDEDEDNPRALVDDEEEILKENPRATLDDEEDNSDYSWRRVGQYPN